MWPILDPKKARLGIREPLHLQPYQWDAATSLAFATLAGGGWGSGKTTAGLGFLATSAMLSPEGSAGMAVQPTHQLLEDWLQRLFLPAFSEVIRHHDVGRKVIHLPGKRILYYRSGHIPEQLQLTDTTYMYLDEPHLMKRQVFQNAVARAREAGGRLRMLLTSLPKIGWLSEEFEGKDDSDRRMIHFSTYQNRHLSEDYIHNLRRACPAHMLACYLEGQFVATGGAVYAMFQKSRHVIPWRFGQWVRMKDGSMSAPVLNYAFDWSPRKPHVLWIQRVPKDAVMPGGWVTEREVSVVIDEIYPDGRFEVVQVRRLCRAVKGRKPPEDTGWLQPYPVGEAVADPAGKAVEATSGESEIIQAERELQIPIGYLHGQRIKVGVQHVQLALDPLDTHPYLFFAESLGANPDPVAGYGDAIKNRQRAVINAIPGYSYPEERGGKFPDEPHKDDVFSHAADCVRYHTRFYYPEDRLAAEAWTVR